MSLTFEDFLQYRNDYQLVPVSCEILSDCRTPIQVLRILKGVSHHCYVLESVERQESLGRYTFLGYDPKLEISCINHELTIRNGKTVQKTVAHPKEEIKKILAAHRSPKIPTLPPFTGGLVGYFSYDYTKYSEPTLNLDARDVEGFKDIDVMLFDKVIVFDHYRQKILLIANASTVAETEEGLRKNYENALAELDEMKKLITNGKEKIEPSGKVTSPFRPLFEKEAFCEMVRKAKEYIYEGDIFEVVLSNRLEADYEGSLLNTYRLLRTINPSPYMFYFCSDDMEVAGASPETLIKVKDNVLHTFPLAGTRPRGKDAATDQALEEELLQDEKELAEHNMLVDLGRNDIGKVSKFGSVFVEKYQSIERFSHVMHIGSTVQGTLDDSHDAMDAMDAILPAGTLSGAPKLRAMEIINELENNKRGIYGGAIGYLDFTGNLDTCIAIRLAFKKNGKVFVRSGAGIVADSVPETEYTECINKAKAVMEAVEHSETEVSS